MHSARSPILLLAAGVAFALALANLVMSGPAAAAPSRTEAVSHFSFSGFGLQRPPLPPNTLYGDNGETILYSWSGGTSGHAWTVHKYANRYVVWTQGRGTYVIGRSVAGTSIPGHADNYMGPGYIAQFSPKEAPPGKLLVNDALFVNDPTVQPPSTPRDGVHGGLGCFAVDFYRIGAGLVDLNCRRLSDGSSPGVYEVGQEIVSGDSLGVEVSMTTRYRDSLGPVFLVSYRHQFTAANVRTTYTWASDTDDVAYVKEPRIVAVFGTADVPIHSGLGVSREFPPNCIRSSWDGTEGHGSGVWALDDDLVRRHHWGMRDLNPWCSTATIGPGAKYEADRHHRGGFSFSLFGVQRDFVYDPNPGDHDYDGVISNHRSFNVWRRDADGAAGIPSPDGAIVDRCPGGDLPPELCDVSIGTKLTIGEASSANAWELGRVPNDVEYAPYGQYGVFIAMEGWRASTSLWDPKYLPRSRTLPGIGVSYSQSFSF
jgi:hypothetical protein